jgi:hypothetical protein
MYRAEDVWAAAFAAYRVNGQYVRAGDVVMGTKEDNTIYQMPSNRSLMAKFLEASDIITDEDHIEGQACRAHFRALPFRMLSQPNVSQFEQSVYLASEMESFESMKNFGLIACLPNIWPTIKARIDADMRFAFSSGYVGKIGEKVTISGTVLECVFSKAWVTHYVRFLTDDEKPVRFSLKLALEIGSRITIAGRVKSQADNCTRLSRVKVIVND